MRALGLLEKGRVGHLRETFPPNQGVSLSAAYAALRHEEPGWVSAVFVRDPLERFLSGWLSKCTNDHDLDREVRGARVEHASMIDMKARLCPSIACALHVPYMCPSSFE
jgi:hypothetical protein